MTQRLYYDDVYIKDFTARVVSCVESGGSYEVVLDRTAFFPEGGGQPALWPGLRKTARKFQQTQFCGSSAVSLADQRAAGR